MIAGSGRAIDYEEDFTQNGETYDLIFDILGKLVAKCKNSLKPNGIYLMASFKTKAFSNTGQKWLGQEGHLRWQAKAEPVFVKSWSRRKSIKRSSTNAIQWNRPPKPTGMLNRD
jgi:hypothetical protein